MKYLHVMPPFYTLRKGLHQPNVPLGGAYCCRAALSAGWSSYLWNADLLPSGVENQFSEEMSEYGKDISLGDLAKTWSELYRVLEDLQPDVVGITALTPSYASALWCAKIVKLWWPACITVIGGPHPSALPNEVARDDDIDYVVTGPGELPLTQLLEAIRQGRTLNKVLHGSNSLPTTWATRGRNIDYNGLLKRDHYGLILSSRGCPYQCHFCGTHNVWGKGVQYRPPGDVAAEMLAIHREYDTRYFSFEDDTFTLNRKHAAAICYELMDRGLPAVPGFRWTANTRPERLDLDILRMMKEAGCAAVAIGIEFGSPRMLQKVNKAFTVDDVRRAVEMINEVGLVSSGQFMVGYPTETEAEMWQTVELARELQCVSVMLSVVTPLPATPLYTEARQLGLIEALDWSKVSTKNDGMLMTDTVNGAIVPMEQGKRQRLIGELKAAFDEIQAATLAAKNESRLKYEQKYLPDDELTPVYGVRSEGMLS